MFIANVRLHSLGALGKEHGSKGALESAHIGSYLRLESVWDSSLPVRS